MADVGIGFRDHAGWAVAVAISAEPAVRDRRRVQLCDPRLPRQVYHAAAGVPLHEAGPLIAGVERSAAEHAEAALADLQRDLRGQGHRVRAVGVCIGTSPIPTDLDAILVTPAAARGRRRAVPGGTRRRGAGRWPGGSAVHDQGPARRGSGRAALLAR
jgi:hypothetical protein